MSYCFLKFLITNKSLTQYVNAMLARDHCEITIKAIYSNNAKQDILLNSFEWKKTPQGSDYWEILYYKSIV